MPGTTITPLHNARARARLGGIGERARANLTTWEAERAEAKRRNAEARAACRERTHERARRRKKKEQNAPMATVTWLDAPVPLCRGSRTMVVGVCSDAAPEVRARYL
jgi:hypothetical protein